MTALNTARLILLYSIAATNALIILGQLEKIGTCTCPGDILTYHCVINATVAGGFTIWQGSAFDCSTEGNRILLRHNSFSSGAFGSCSGGSLTGRSLPTGAVVTTDTNYIYTSQLQADFNSNPSLIGRTIECVYNPNGDSVISIGTATIDITDPIPPPGDVKLVEASPSELTFSWSSAQDGCSTLRYQIESNCSSCSMNPSSVSDTTYSATCSIEPAGTADNYCTFSVRTVVCNNNITGNLSTPVKVNLKVPDSPDIHSATPTYNEKGKLENIHVKFASVNSFQISQGIDGSPLYYIVNISDAMTNIVCQSKNVSATLCNQGVCSVTSNNLSNNCSMSANVNVTVIAINRLGQSQSNHILIQNTNSYVNVSFEQNGKIVCTFPESLSNGQNTNDKSCVIMYGSCDQELTMSTRGIANSSNTVIIDFLERPSTSFCYVINANNGTFAVQSQGMFSQNEPTQLSAGSVAIIVSVTILMTVVMIIILFIIILCYFRKQYRKTDHTKKDTEDSEEMSLVNRSEDSNSEFQPVRANIIFDIEDMLEKLINALQILSSTINIKNIKVCAHGLEKPQATLRTVYIECDNDLSSADEENIRSLIEPKLSSVEVHSTAKEKQVQKGEEHGSRYIKEVTEVLRHKPGALCSHLKIFQETEDCKYINITDIVIEPSKQKNDDCKRVTIKFIPELPRDWKEKYDKMKEKCEDIVPIIEDKSLSTSL